MACTTCRVCPTRAGWRWPLRRPRRRVQRADRAVRRRLGETAATACADATRPSTVRRCVGSPGRCVPSCGRRDATDGRWRMRTRAARRHAEGSPLVCRLTAPSAPVTGSLGFERRTDVDLRCGSANCDLLDFLLYLLQSPDFRFLLSYEHAFKGGKMVFKDVTYVTLMLGMQLCNVQLHA